MSADVCLASPFYESVNMALCTAEWKALTSKELSDVTCVDCRIDHRVMLDRHRKWMLSVELSKIQRSIQLSKFLSKLLLDNRVKYDRHLIVKISDRLLDHNYDPSAWSLDEFITDQ